HVEVPASWSTSCLADVKKSATSCSLPALASSRAKIPKRSMRVLLLLGCGVSLTEAYLHIGPPQGRDNRSVTEFSHLKRHRVEGYRTIILSDPTSALFLAAPGKITPRFLDTVR